MNYTYSLKKIHASLICAGDIVERAGKHITLCANDIKHDSFMGTTIRGDSYHCGRKPVIRVDVFHAKPKPNPR